MLEKTIGLALDKARENNLSKSEQEHIESYINTAFMGYTESWEGVHTLEETKEEWEWFYNILKEKSLQDALAELEYENSKRPSIWIKSFIGVIQILQSTPIYDRWIDQLNAFYWKIVKTPEISVKNLDKANEIILEAIEKLRPLANP